MFLVEQELREQRSSGPSCQAQREGKGREKVYTRCQTMRHSGDGGKQAEEPALHRHRKLGRSSIKTEIQGIKDKREKMERGDRIESSQKRWKTILSSAGQQLQQEQPETKPVWCRVGHAGEGTVRTMT